MGLYYKNVRREFNENGLELHPKTYNFGIGRIYKITWLGTNNNIINTCDNLRNALDYLQGFKEDQKEQKEIYESWGEDCSSNCCK